MDELRKLADRFRRLADRREDASQGLSLACEDGGQLLVQLSEAGRLPFTLPAPEQGGAPSDYVGHAWAVLWEVGVLAMAAGNPHCIEWKATSANVRIGTTSRETWRDRAERYAEFCDSLAAELEPDRADGKDKPRLIVHRSHKGDAIEFDGTKYPVSDKWADAFDAMLKANGAAVGINKIVGKASRDKMKLPEELQGILHSQPGNKGYVLQLKNVAPTLG